MRKNIDYTSRHKNISMNKKIIIGVLSFVLFVITWVGSGFFQKKHNEGKYESGALRAFEWWYAQRALPYEMIPQGAYQNAVGYLKTSMIKENSRSTANIESSQWISLGPTNIGGRVLAIAIDPTNPEIIWTGSASGGLWKSTTAGEGTNAWTYINTGFNTLSVSTVALDPSNPDIIYIGTGEISHYRRPLVGTPGARASYGMGALKSTDGGTTWSQTNLTWTFPEITAVQKIIINPQNPQSIFAATSEGVFKSFDGGASWIQTPTPVMAMDVIMNPADTSTLFSAHGNLNSSPVPGLYKTTNAGFTWTKLTSGLPTSNFGRTSLSISSSAPSTVYAGIADAATSGVLGLYKTINDGANWTPVTTQNYVGSQGWYDNVIAAHPQSPDTIYCAGFDIHKSIDGGVNLPAISSGRVHVDHHAIAFHPSDFRIVYFGTDGGVYKTTDGGETFIDCNGGFITTQFYPGFANAYNDTTISLGGLQDNGTLKYAGSSSWNQIFGADGGWCAIDPTNANVLYFEYQWLNLYKSTNGGSTSSRITNGLPTGSTNANFIPPFVLSPSNSQVLYAGSNNVYKSTTGGSLWFPSNGETTLNGTNIACIGMSYTSHDTVIACTGTGTLGATPLFEIFLSVNGGLSWTNVTYRLNGTDSLPNRYPTDIEFNPVNSNIAYLTYSGYGTPHVFTTENLAQSWTDISNNLPDIPHQAIVVDPESPENIYVGTDLGVFHSSSNGSVWEEFSTGMPPAMALDLTISRNNGKLRASTFGNGVYERPLFRIPTLSLTIPDGGEVWASGYPENIVWSQKFLSSVRLEYSTDNGLSWSLIADSIPAAQGSYQWNVPQVGTEVARVKITDVLSSALADSSTSPFTIMLNPDFIAGWNLISIPYTVSDARTEVLYPNAVSEAFTYNGTYVQQESLRVGSGYWLKFNIPESLTFEGDSVFTDTVDVFTGWNLIGAITLPASISDIVEDPPGIITSDVFGYKQGYQITDTLFPKYGYWVKVNSNGKLILSTPQSGNESRRTISDGLKSVKRLPDNSITIRDGRGNRQTLYFTTNGSSEFKRSELPPPPPCCRLDARFADGTMIADISAGKQIPISVSAEYFPLVIDWQYSEKDGKAYLTVNGISRELNSSGTISVTEKIISLSLGAVDGVSPMKPLTFRLDQNYPNPFNPTTKMSFVISSPAGSLAGQLAFVTLKVYNILGQEVAVVIDKKMEPGTYETELDGSNLPSGVYLYHLEARGADGTNGVFRETRKMILMK